MIYVNCRIDSWESWEQLAPLPTHPWSCGDTDATGTVVLPLVFLDVLIYLLMVDIDPDVMNMFTQDYGLTAAELTRVRKNLMICW